MLFPEPMVFPEPMLPDPMFPMPTFPEPMFPDPLILSPMFPEPMFPMPLPPPIPGRFTPGRLPIPGQLPPPAIGRRSPLPPPPGGCHRRGSRAGYRRRRSANVPHPRRRRVGYRRLRRWASVPRSHRRRAGYRRHPDRAGRGERARPVTAAAIGRRFPPPPAPGRLPPPGKPGRLPPPPEPGRGRGACSAGYRRRRSADDFRLHRLLDANRHRPGRAGARGACSGDCLLPSPAGCCLQSPARSWAGYRRRREVSWAG